MRYISVVCAGLINVTNILPATHYLFHYCIFLYERCVCYISAVCALLISVNGSVAGNATFVNFSLKTDVLFACSVLFFFCMCFGSLVGRMLG